MQWILLLPTVTLCALPDSCYLVMLQVSFKDEPGEGSGVARSFYVAFAQAVLSSEKLSSLDGILVGGKTLQYSLYFFL